VTSVESIDSLDALAWLVDPTDPEAHRAVLERREFVVPVLGSGISLPVGFPGGPALVSELERFAAEVGCDATDLEMHDPRSVAEILVQRGIDRDSLLRTVGEIYGRQPAASSATIDALLNVPSRRIVTLNYDCSLESRAGELGIDFESLVLRSGATTVIDRFLADSDRDRLVIVHAHGVAAEPETIVLDEQGYRELTTAPLVTDWFRQLIFGYRLVFMGTRLDELHILSELQRLGFLAKRNLLVAPANVVEELRTGRSALLPGTHTLLIRGYADHGQLTPLAELLTHTRVVEASPEVGGQTFPIASEGVPSDYVDTLMLEACGLSEDDLWSSYLFGLQEQATVPLERMLVSGARTVIEGPPGSGKTTLLLEIGSRQPEEVTALRLRAPNLDLVGDASLLLSRWLDVAEAFREGEAADLLRLDSGVFHFLIDGLDEVPVGQQTLAVRRILEVAEASSAHSFTIASRAVPALEAFDGPEWMRVVLVPSAEWRRKYLARHAVEWSDLVAAAPLLNDLQDLLNLPFFLSHTVDRFVAGDLTQTADMLSLVAGFVDSSLEDVEGAISLEAVREWLRRLALGMLLAGRIDVSLGEIAASLTDELSEYGDAESVAERLVTAPLLRAVGPQRYAFVHRILGEALAAEALRDLTPDASRLLDVAAPVVSDRLKGLRSDWLVPLTLVASASEAWRKALADRDPLAAARAVPPDAPLEERQASARLIWAQYAEWRVWIHDYDRISIVEDETVLARLLATEGLEDLRDEIRTAMTSDVREVVGNAIMVLANLGDRTVEPILRAVLESNPDYVLRRMAAIAARDLDLDGLLYLIAHRALHPEDTTEAQDMTYAVIDLADPEELALFALKAARKGAEASSTLSYALRGRVDRRTEFDVLRARAERRAEPFSRERNRLQEILPSLDLTDPAVAEAVVFVAGAWSVDVEETRVVIRDHAVSAARALVELERTGAAYAFELDWILEEIDIRDLERAGVPEPALMRKRSLDEWRRRSVDT
jgi:hypothetical protein